MVCRVKNKEHNLFDESTYENLKSISEVYDQVCSCETIAGTNEKKIECSYGTFKTCKFFVGKQFHCILNPEGQSRRKRDLRHIGSLMSKYEVKFELFQYIYILNDFTLILCK